MRTKSKVRSSKSEVKKNIEDVMMLALAIPIAIGWFTFGFCLCLALTHQP